MSWMRGGTSITTGVVGGGVVWYNNERAEGLAPNDAL